MTPDLSYWNYTRFQPGNPDGHYESYFQRANHPERPLAFWIRYTVFCPRRQPDLAVGELWAIYFDGEARRITAAKQVYPIRECAFSSQGLDVRIGPAWLRDGALQGQAVHAGHSLRWSLGYSGGGAPLLLLPEAYYAGGFPKAKSLVGTPGAVYNGELWVDEQEIPIRGWVGSQNHNWGSKHTDLYAWGQVAGFDDAPGACLELSTARLKFGPVWTPWMTLVVLRLDGQEYALNSLGQAIRAAGRFLYGRGADGGSDWTWRFDSHRQGLRIQGEIAAPPSLFVGLRYDNPPGGFKTCLNSKLARCQVTLERPGQPPRRLETAHRAAFEILTDAADHGVVIAA